MYMIKLTRIITEGKRYFYNIGEPKTEKYSEHTRANCWTPHGFNQIYVEFGDEYNGYVVDGMTAGKRNNIIALKKYFNKVELYKIG